MVLVRIKRSEFTKLSQDKLAKFAKVIISKTNKNSIYDQLKDALADLKIKSDAFDVALVAAAEGGKGLVARKNLAMKNLINSLDLLCNLAEVYCNGNEDYITDMGFTLKGKEKRSRLPLETPELPEDIIVESTGKIGELRVRFKLPNKEHVVNVAVEHRIANSNEPFQNGLYMNTENMVLSGFPQLQMMELRFRALGRENLRSDWTTAVTAPVL